MSKIQKLELEIKKLYRKNKRKLPFHGWHHIYFVSQKAAEFAHFIKADVFLVESAGLVHDLNYIVKPNSEPEIAVSMRKKYLSSAGYTVYECERIEKIILESHTKTRSKKITKEGMALSDADTLFKALPITPILFAGKYISESKADVMKLANKIVSEQNKLMESGIYFYTPQARRRYLKWAKINLALWNNVIDALKDEDIIKMLKLV